MKRKTKDILECFNFCLYVSILDSLTKVYPQVICNRELFAQSSKKTTRTWFTANRSKKCIARPYMRLTPKWKMNTDQSRKICRKTLEMELWHQTNTGCRQWEMEGISATLHGILRGDCFVDYRPEMGGWKGWQIPQFFFYFQTLSS